MKKKIVLFQPFVFSSERMFFSVPMALLGISRVLDKEGYEIKIITPRTHPNYIESIVKEAKDSICVGVSSITGQPINDNLEVSKALKKQLPNIPIVWGGWHPSMLPVETINNENVDIVVKGQGERTFPELVHALEKNKSLKKIKGIVYKTNTGKIIINEDRPLETLDNFPLLPYHLLDVEKYITPTDFGERSLYYYSSIGCPQRCLFCLEPAVNKSHWVGLSPEKAADEITSLKNKYHLDSVQINDSNFFISESRAVKFAQRLIDNNTNIKWGNANGRARQMSLYRDKTWGLLKKSGLTSILVGAESGDNKTLEYMQKDITIQDTLKLISKCAQYDIKALCAFLVGFPRDESNLASQKIVDKELRSAYKLIDKLLKINPKTRVWISLYLPYPSSGFFDLSHKLGIKIPNKLEDWHDYLISAESAKNIKLRLPWITKKQAFEALMCSNYIFFFLGSDSLELTLKGIKKLYKKVFIVPFFKLAKFIVSVRWKYKFFGFPVDFYLFETLRNHFSY